jgi:hypothetical protein
MHFGTANNDNTRSQYLPFTAQCQCDSLRVVAADSFASSALPMGGKTKNAKNKPVNSKHVKHTCYEKDGKMYVPYIVRLFSNGIHTEERTHPGRS